MRSRRAPGLNLCMLALLSLAAGCASPEFELDRDTLGFELPRTPVMVFFVDGVHKETFEEMVRKGELPLLQRHLLDRGVAVENAITGVPSVTYANATSMVTGQYPGHHGIFANRWFDQNLLASRSYESASTMSDVNHDFIPPTIYEILDGKVTCVIGMQVNRGAHIKLVTDTSDGGLSAGLAWILGRHDHFDSIIVGSLGDVAEQSRIIGHWPDLTLLYFPGVDAIGHSAGPQSEGYRSALRNVDLELGSALRTLDDAGLLDRMTIVLTSDHGHHQVGAEAFLEIGHFLQGRLGIPTYLTNTAGEQESELPYAGRSALFRQFRIVATHSGERYASLHLQSKDGWSRHPTLEEMLAFHRNGAGSTDPSAAALTFPEVLVREPAIDFAAVRVSDDEVRLWGKRGVCVIGRRTSEDGATYKYGLLEGEDPLGYGSDPDLCASCDGEYRSQREWLEATAALAHPDIVPRLGEAFESPRAGDIMIFAAPGWDFSPDYLGGHGGIERDEMLIPMYFAGPGLRPGGKVHAARLADLVPTILDLMGWRDSELHPHHFDGVSIADLLRGQAAGVPVSASAPRDLGTASRP